MSEKREQPISYSPDGKFQEESRVLDSELNYRINKIIGNIPEYIKQNVYERMSQPSDFQPSAPLDQFKVTFGAGKLNPEQIVPTVTKAQEFIPNIYNANKAVDTGSQRTDYNTNAFQQKLWERRKEEEEGLFQPQEMPEKQSLKRLVANMDTINQRMEKAIQGSREVTKKFDQNISDFVTKYLNSSPNKDLTNDYANRSILASQKDSQTVRIHESLTNSQPFVSTQKFNSPNSSYFSQGRPFSTPYPYKRNTGSIGDIFEESIRRSEAILHQNQDFDRKYSLGPLSKVKRTLGNFGASDSTKKSYLEAGIRSTTGKPYGSPTKTLSEPSLLSASSFQKASPVNSESLKYDPLQEEVKIRAKKQGKGTIEFEDGSKYTGEWEDGLRNGYGVKTLPNGEVEYEGEWLDDRYNGTGILVNTNPKITHEAFDYEDFRKVGNIWIRYEGEFDFGRWHGLGTLHLSNGEKFRGKFKFGEVHGAGTYTQKSGTVITGEWQENKFLGPL